MMRKETKGRVNMMPQIQKHFLTTEANKCTDGRGRHANEEKITSAVIGRNVRTAEERGRIVVFQRKGDTGTTSKGSEHAEKYPHGEKTETASVSVANSNM